jgi:hypothetical protein
MGIPFWIDNLMTWIARLFSVLLVISTSVATLYAWIHPDVNPVSRVVMLSRVAFFLWELILLSCIWKARSKVARWFMGLSSGFFLAIALISFVFLLWNSFSRLEGTPGLLVIGVLGCYAAFFLGFGSIMWTAVRPSPIFSSSSDSHARS